MCENCSLIERHYQAVMEQSLLKQKCSLRDAILSELREIELATQRETPNVDIVARRLKAIRRLLSD